MKKHRTGLPARLLLLLGGIVLALALAEASLWVAGPLLSPPAKAPADAAGWRVLCVGDSFVYGLGSEDGRGSCDHLQALFDERWGPGVASVHNEGVPGFNSSQAASELEGWLRQYEPQAVVILVGHNNSWNFNDLHFEAVAGGEGMGLARSLGRLRLVRLLRLVTRYRQAGPDEQAKDPEVEAWAKTARKAGKKEKSAQAIPPLRQRLAEHPDDVYTMLRLAQALGAAGQRDEADRWKAKAKEIDPDAVARLQDAQRRIEAFHHRQVERGEDTYLAETHAADAALYRALQATAADAAPIEAQRQLLDDVLRADLRSMHALAHDHGAEVVFTGYPRYKPANEVLAATAAELGAPWVDQEAAFAERLSGEEDLSPWFLLDSHCTSAGYRIMAENLAPVLFGFREGSGQP